MKILKIWKTENGSFYQTGKLENWNFLETGKLEN